MEQVKPEFSNKNSLNILVHCNQLLSQMALLLNLELKLKLFIMFAFLCLNFR